MGNVKDLRQTQIERAAGNFLSEEPEGSLFGAYLRLVEEVEKGNGKDLAANHVVGEKLYGITVKDLVDVIEAAVAEAENAPEFLKKIDFTDLRTQKRLLLETINNDAVDPEHKEGLEGILNLLDGLQDYAVDEMGMNPMNVYDFEQEEERGG